MFSDHDLASLALDSASRVALYRLTFVPAVRPRAGTVARLQEVLSGGIAMSVRYLSLGLVLAGGLVCHALLLNADDAIPPAAAPDAGIEVLARGPVHEAF